MTASEQGLPCRKCDQISTYIKYHIYVKNHRWLIHKRYILTSEHSHSAHARTNIDVPLFVYIGCAHERAVQAWISSDHSIHTNSRICKSYIHTYIETYVYIYISTAWKGSPSLDLKECILTDERSHSTHVSTDIDVPLFIYIGRAHGRALEAWISRNAFSQTSAATAHT
jgi:hypothetical protein